LNIFTYRPLTEVDFLSRQTMVFDSSTRAGVGTLATITPAANETFVLLGAHIFCTAASIDVVGGVIVELRNESNVRDLLGFGGGVGGGSSSSVNHGFDFSLVKGDRLEGDGIKTYTLEWVTETAVVSLGGSLYGYLRKT